MDTKDQEILEKLNIMEKKLDSIMRTNVMLAELVNGVITRVDSVCTKWRYDFMEKHNLKKSDVGIPKIDTEEILRLSQEGLSVEAIAIRMGCSKSTVINHRNKLKAQGRM